MNGDRILIQADRLFAIDCDQLYAFLKVLFMLSLFQAYCVVVQDTHKKHIVQLRKVKQDRYLVTHTYHRIKLVVIQ